MARLSVGLMLVLACWTASSSGAAISLEAKLEQLTNNYNEMKQELTSKIGQLETQIQQGRAHPTSPVYFYAQRSAPFSTKAVKLPFDAPLLNAGNALDAASGTFTAPRAGIYSFSFTGMANFPETSGVYVWLSASLFLNGNVVGSGEVDEANTVADQWSPLFLQVTLSLAAGDQVWLEIDYDTAGIVLHDDADHYTHFNGWMLDE